MIKLAIFKFQDHDRDQQPNHPAAIASSITTALEQHTALEHHAEQNSMQQSSLQDHTQSLEDSTEHETEIISPGVLAWQKTRKHHDIILKRARIIARNRVCPQCNAVKISLWETTPRHSDEQELPSLNILFHCDCCHTSWHD